MAIEADVLDENRLAKIAIDNIGLDGFLRLGLDGAVHYARFKSLISDGCIDLSMDNINIDEDNRPYPPYEGFNNFQAKIIKFILLNCGEIERFNLEDFEFTEKGFNIVLDAFEKKPYLILQMNEIWQIYNVSNFLTALRKKVGNVELGMPDFSNSMKAHENFVSLMVAIAKSKVLKKIRLRDLYQVETANELIKSLKANESLKEINFGHKLANNPEIIYEILKNKKEIETITISVEPNKTIDLLKVFEKKLPLKEIFVIVYDGLKEVVNFNYHACNIDTKTQIFEAFKKTAVLTLGVKSHLKLKTPEQIAKGFQEFCKNPIEIIDGKVNFAGEQAAYEWYREFLKVRSDIDVKFSSLNEFAVDLDFLQDEMKSPVALVMNRIFADENLRKRFVSLLKESSEIGELFRNEYSAIRNGIMDNNFGGGLKRRLIGFEFDEQIKIEQMNGAEIRPKSHNVIFPKSSKLERSVYNGLTESRIVEFLTLNFAEIKNAEQEKNANHLMLFAMRDANSRMLEEYMSTPEIFQENLTGEKVEIDPLNLSFIKFLKKDLGKILQNVDASFVKALKESRQQDEFVERSI